MIIKKTYPGGRKRAVTFSYDDGVGQDIALSAMLDRYALKCTFNINSGMFAAGAHVNEEYGSVVGRLSQKAVGVMYNGHEIAVHALNHPHLEALSREEVYREISEDMKNLSELAGYQVRGMAYPYGTYNDTVISVLSELGIVYSRTVASTEAFSPPENPLTLHPTCHHKNPRVLELIEQFKSSDEELALLYIWGHSYEFDFDHNWNHMEEICRRASGINDAWYATNIEIVDYINASRQLEITEKYVKNHSDSYLWFTKDRELIRLAPEKELVFEK